MTIEPKFVLPLIEDELSPVMVFLAKLFQVGNQLGFHLIESTLMDCFVTLYFDMLYRY